MAVFVVSDLHLMDRTEPFLFNHEKESRFRKLCEHIIATDGQLLLAGDIFDFTGMTPPKHGLSEFFAEVLPAEKLDSFVVTHACKMRTTFDLLISIKKVFPHFFSSLKKIAERNRLTYIPGNHDCDFLSLESRVIFANVLEVEPDKIIWTDRFEYKDCLLVVHGNQFDVQNQTNGTCQNPGFVFTSALYHGVLPALKMLSVNLLVIAAIPAVRPEEEVISGLKNFLDDETLKKILLALTRLLARNGYFRGFGSVPGFLLTHSVPVFSKLFERFVTVNRVRGVLPKDEWLILNARKGANALRLQNPKYTDVLIAMGHTHELDAKLKYVNLGTWIDHLPGLHPNNIENPEVSLPVLHVDENGAATLYNIRDLEDPQHFRKSTIIFNC